MRILTLTFFLTKKNKISVESERTFIEISKGSARLDISNHSSVNRIPSKWNTLNEGTEPFCFQTISLSLPGAKVPMGNWPIRSLELLLLRTFIPWNFHSLEHSLPRAHWPWNFCFLELPFSRVFTPWNFRSLLVRAIDWWCLLWLYSRLCHLLYSYIGDGTRLPE